MLCSVGSPTSAASTIYLLGDYLRASGLLSRGQAAPGLESLSQLPDQRRDHARAGSATHWVRFIETSLGDDGKGADGAPAEDCNGGGRIGQLLKLSYNCLPSNVLSALVLCLGIV